MTMKRRLLNLAGCLFVLFSASCKKENSSTSHNWELPPNKVNVPVQGGEPGCAYGAVDGNGKICIVDWQGNILPNETAELERYAQTGIREDHSQPTVATSGSGNTEHFTPSYSEGSSASNTDGWKIAGDVVSSPEFWKLVSKAIEYGSGSESKPVHVDSYTDKHGRNVPEHYRSKPNQK